MSRRSRPLATSRPPLAHLSQRWLKSTTGIYHQPQPDVPNSRKEAVSPQFFLAHNVQQVTSGQEGVYLNGSQSHDSCSSVVYIGIGCPESTAAEPTRTSRWNRFSVENHNPAGNRGCGCHQWQRREIGRAHV